MKIKTKEVQRIYNLLNMNLDKVEDFDIAVKLKEIMNVLESKNEIINIALAAIDFERNPIVTGKQIGRAHV